ncbi:HD domain-containing protein [Candidatus Wolfebacteria bacterium]|nr:HD domain-containing protein [Candidatus Wolfebacteria bacterium]
MEIPKEITIVANKLVDSGYSAYLVGGCVRDILMNRDPQDWDIATNAKPEEIQKIFPDSVYENQFGTVGIKTTDHRLQTTAVDRSLSTVDIVEITTFRLEGRYTDKRHPDEIKFAKTIEEDLGRRDFTINAMALDLGIMNKELGIKNKKEKDVGEDSSFIIHNSKFRIIDPFAGQSDLENKIIRTVGNPEERFNEDALRLMRAVRFAVQLDFSAKGGPASGWAIEKKTEDAVKKHAGLLKMIAGERIRDELIKIVMTERAAKDIQSLEDLGLLQYIIPELREGIGVGQNKHHIYNVWEHNLRALDYAVKKNYSVEIRFAALLHDVGKPRTKAGDGPDSTFYNHEVVGAKMTAGILDRLHFPKELRDKVIHLVRYHLFYYNVGEVTEAGVRRFLRRVGPENIDDLLKVREADRIGSGVPKAFPYKLRHLQFMIEKVKADPISPKMLKVNGEDVMKILGIEPGPKVGYILSVLLEEVLDDPEKNSKEKLEAEIKKLGNLDIQELEKMAKGAREKKEEFEGGVEEEMKKKYYVR